MIVIIVVVTLGSSICIRISTCKGSIGIRTTHDGLRLYFVFERFKKDYRKKFDFIVVVLIDVVVSKCECD